MDKEKTMRVKKVSRALLGQLRDGESIVVEHCDGRQMQSQRCNAQAAGIPFGCRFLTSAKGNPIDGYTLTVTRVPYVKRETEVSPDR